jgi:hypothetical protein
MAEILDTVDETETLLIVAAVLAVGYFIYASIPAVEDFINNLFGLSDGDAATAPVGYGGTYVNAVNQTVSAPVTTVGSILGLGSPGGGQSELLSDLSSVGYTKIGASGQHWSCSGPKNAANDNCQPVSVDGSGNMTATGAAVPAAQAN